MTPTVATWLHAARNALVNACRYAHRDGDARTERCAAEALRLVSCALDGCGDPEVPPDGCQSDAPVDLAHEEEV